mmetsp:Transcript_40294/g.53058  ORF Transcript_40294/g.53058 Transcript_40294/m.53058 type:complete len:1023 (+) Transcript_40294:63-3131(+)
MEKDGKEEILLDRHREASGNDPFQKRKSSIVPPSSNRSSMGQQADLLVNLKKTEDVEEKSTRKVIGESGKTNPLVIKQRSMDGSKVSDVSTPDSLYKSSMLLGMPPPLPSRPLSSQSQSSAPEALWYFASGVESGKPGAKNDVQGPTDATELQQLWREAAIDERTLFWKPGMPGWESLKHLPALFEEVRNPPPLPDEENNQRQTLEVMFVDGVPHNPTPVEVLTMTRTCSVCGALAAFECRSCGSRGLQGVGESADKSFGTGYGASEIIPSFLWIGNLRATHRRSLEALKFTHILNATADIPDVAWEDESMADLVKDIGYLRIPLREDVGIYDYLEEAYNFVELARCSADGQKYSKTGNRVLIHSETGNHRPAFLVIGYLIRRDGLMYDEALEFVQSKRETIEMQPKAVYDLKRWSEEHSVGRLYCQDCLQDVHEFHGDNRLEESQVNGMARRMEEEAPSLTVVDHRGQGLSYEEATILSHALRLSARVHSLILDGCNMGDQGLSVLAQAVSYTPQLAHLGLSYNNITVTGVVALISALQECSDNQVSFLDLSYNNISEDAGKNLGGYLQKLTNLTHLNVANNQLGDEGVYCILEPLAPRAFLSASEMLSKGVARSSSRRRTPRRTARKKLSEKESGHEENKAEEKDGEQTPEKTNPESAKPAVAQGGVFGVASDEDDAFNGTLTSLDISCNNAGQKSGNRLAEIIKHNQVLFSLKANFNPGLGKSEIKAMANNFRLYNKTLEQLSLCQNLVGDDGAATFARNLGMASDEGCQLKALHLAENSILSMGANRLSAGLVKNSTLTYLELSNNLIRTKGANHLARALEENSTLKRLEISACGIDHEGVVCIAFSLLKNKGLENLNISENEVGKEGSKAISNALMTNTTLHTLDLTNCQVGMAGAEFLAKVFRENKTMKEIFLRGNQIRDPGAKALARNLTANYTLSKIDLGFNYITSVGIDGFKVALQTPSSAAIEKKVFNLDIDFTGNAVAENQPFLSRSKQRISFSTTNRFDVSYWSKQIQAP